MVLSFAHGWGRGMGSARGGAHDQICHSTDSFTFTRQHRSAPQTTLTHRHALQSPTCANEHVGTRHTETNRSPDHERQRLVLEPLRSRAPAKQSAPAGAPHRWPHSSTRSARCRPQTSGRHAYKFRQVLCRKSEVQKMNMKIRIFIR